MKTKKENQKTDPQPAKCHPIALGSIDEMLAQNEVFISDLLFENDSLNRFVQEEEFHFNNCQFTHTELNESTLSANEYLDCRFVRCSFSASDLSRSRFFRCQFENCRLSGTLFYDCSFKDVSFSNCLMDYANFGGSSFERCRYEQCSLKEGGFSLCRQKHL